MTSAAHLASLIKQLYPDNGIEFLSEVVSSIAPDSTMNYIISLLEIETL